MTYPADVVEEAIELRLQGATYEEISEKCGPDSDTVRRWFAAEPPDRQAQANQAKYRRGFDELVDARYRATHRLNERIPSLADKELVSATRGLNAALHSEVRLIQDEHKANTMIEELRRLLRAKDPSTLRAELNTQGTPPVIQALPPSPEP